MVRSPARDMRAGDDARDRQIEMPAERSDGDARMVRTSMCVTRAIAGETLIVPIARGTADLESIFTLNAVGSRVWQLLERPIAPAEVVASIVEEFDVSADEAAQDVSAFLESLRAAGLIAPAAGRD